MDDSEVESSIRAAIAEAKVSLKAEITEARVESLKEIQQAREYAVDQADKKRNQAIGSLGFAALVLGVAGWLLIDQTVETKLKAVGEAKILERAQVAAKAAEQELGTARTVVRELKLIQASYSSELQEFQRTSVEELSKVTSEFDKRYAISIDESTCSVYGGYPLLEMPGPGHVDEFQCPVNRVVHSLGEKDRKYYVKCCALKLVPR